MLDKKRINVFENATPHHFVENTPILGNLEPHNTDGDPIEYTQLQNKHININASDSIKKLNPII